MALSLIDKAAAAGADIVKFQTFKSDSVISRHAQKAEYQKKTTDSDESQLAMVKKLELDLDAHRRLARHCQNRGVRFLSTPFDMGSVDLLVRDLNVSLIKIPSGEITNAPLMLKIARTGRPVILSTGMSSLGEIEAALGVLSFGYVVRDMPPSAESFVDCFQSEAGQSALRENVSLLHCTTEYPAPFDEVNLRAMATMSTAFGLPVGYSDHTQGIAIPIAAVAMGARILEKHFTLDRSLPGPDHVASLEPDELTQMVAAVRQVELALGHGAKLPMPSELKNKAIARKSLVAATAIKSGEQFSELNLATKRPGTGISPMHYWEYLGYPAKRDYMEDEMI
jgi:N-acetylneuraminate synthase